jgi:SAM-dependent methyltransferase
MLWREYWQPAHAFFEVDLRLIQRLNRLKKAWLDILQHPEDRLCQMTYCWRYFGLLHHALRIAKDEPSRPDALPAIRHIIGFEAFLLDAAGETGTAACTVTSRNPSFLLGQLAVDPTVPTPRHVPLLMPPGQNDAFYLYRQVQLSGMPATRILASPAVDLPHRASSFVPIDRLTRLISERADPYWKPRAKLLARRLLAPLLRARTTSPSTTEPLSILDLGAGTGQLVAKAWTYLERMSAGRVPSASLHFVDSNPPAFGRSFGLTRNRSGVTHVEWTTADYRTLADDDQWLHKCGPFDWVFACRVLDNASNFMIERVAICDDNHNELSLDALPHRCLSPRSQPGGIRRLMVSTVRRQASGGTVFPQYSLRDYFGGILSIQNRAFDHLHDDACWYLPVRRFNPAAFITPSGRSLIAQIMKVSRAIIIEDVDAEPEHLKQHKDQFGLPGTAAVFCTRDGFNTEANYYVVTSQEWAMHIRGERLW